MTATQRLNLSAVELTPGDLIVEGLQDSHDLAELYVYDTDGTPIARNVIDPDATVDGQDGTPDTSPVVRVWTTLEAQEKGSPAFLVVDAASCYVVERAEDRLTDQQRAAFDLPPRG